MSLHAVAAYAAIAHAEALLGADVVERELIATFRAYLIGTSGPVQGAYKLTLGTDTRHKDALWGLTDYVGEFFEVEIRTVRVHSPIRSEPLPEDEEMNEADSE